MGYYAEQYKEQKGELAPLYEIMSNEVFSKQFEGEPERLYRYCLDNNLTWKQALAVNISENDSILY